jgi:hypothetical protein
MRITRPTIRLDGDAGDWPPCFVDGGGVLYLTHPTYPELLAIYPSVAAYNTRAELPHYRSRKDVQAQGIGKVQKVTIETSCLLAIICSQW